MSHIEAVCVAKPALQYNNDETAEIKSAESTDDIFSASNAADNPVPYKTSFFSKWEYDPEVGDYMPKKSVFSKIGDFFSGIGNAIKSFFEKLFGGKKTEETDNNTNETNETNENDWGYFTGGNLPDKSKLDFNVPENVKQELIDKFDLSFYDTPDCVDFFYDTDGELVVLMPTDPTKDVGYYNQFGEIRYECQNEKVLSDVVGIAVNVEPNWESSDENNKAKDGIIGDTQQGQLGDCWLLSGVNALSYTEEGQKIIKDALEYHDGYTTVHLKGAIDYDITDEEVEKARSENYSTGDDDMLILELAAKKAYEDIANRNIMLDSGFYDILIWGNDGSINGSNSAFLMYLITGRECYARNPKQTGSWNGMFLQDLEFFKEHNNKDVAMVLSADETAIMQDVNGNSVQIYAPHAYAVKDVDENNLTFTNPHDSSIEITISKDMASRVFSGYQMCNFGDEKAQCGRAKESIIDENGDRIFVYDEPGTTYNYENQAVEYARRELRYSKDGERIGSTYYDEAGNEIYKSWY